jgi:PD-(D/E)XK nuclease superfamily protein
MKKVKNAPDYVVDLLQREDWQKPSQPYIKPSSLAKGCLLYVAFELQGRPKPPMDARVGRILSVGTDSHRRLQRVLSRACLAQELYFMVPEYRIHGFVDGVLYISPENAPDPSTVGFWILEFKTTAGSEFDKIKAAKMPKEEHIRQSQIYLWGLDKYFNGQIPLKGAIIFYENRDTLDHAAYQVEADPETTADLMSRVQSMLAPLDEGKLPDDYLPADHWGHRYCPYLEICDPGQKAMEWQAQQPKSLPDEVLASMIAKRIIAKKGAEKMTEKKKKGRRSLAELTEELKWE